MQLLELVKLVELAELVEGERTLSDPAPHQTELHLKYSQLGHYKQGYPFWFYFHLQEKD